MPAATAASTAPDELREIERQNTITAQILENFLERRLFPNKRPTHRLPTLDDILPPRTTTTERPTPPPWLRRLRNGTMTAVPAHSFDDVSEEQNDGDVDGESVAYDDENFGDDGGGGGLGGSAEEDYNYRDPESLQSVESEHVDRYLESFRRRIEGMC